MDIIISNNSNKPIYEQIYEQIASQIINGRIEADFCLPSIRSIAKEIGISVITIQKAWDSLEQNGLIYTVAGKGCFVSGHSNKKLEDKKITLAEERLSVELPFYKSLGLSLNELTALIKKNY